MPRPWTLLDSADTPDGPLELRQRDERDFMITIAGRVLMTSLANRSEIALGQLGCTPLAHKARPRVLIGGLGMGYTLRAALDALPPGARVTVVELNAVVEKWCRGPLAPLTEGALDDPRVLLVLDDISRFLSNAPGKLYDAILLDLYEGPNHSTQGSNDPHYGHTALALSRHALAPKGVLAIWAEETDTPFERRFRQAGFRVERLRVGRGGRRHAVYLGRT
ncbi:MAG: spermidine synthase [Armatimonadetes bacterium]|nr:spermidine synthase [Armatimonadota bacterium]